VKKNPQENQAEMWTLGAVLGAAPRHVVVVGGGWAGYSACDALSASPDCKVTLLEASPRAAGGLAAGWRTPGGRPVEAGIHGFWREYKNTFSVLDSLGLDHDDVLTPFTPSVLVSARGKVATAPVLATTSAGAGESKGGTSSDWAVRGLPLTQEALLGRLSNLLPAPLDTALLADFPPSSPLTLADRASAVGLLACWADFRQEEAASWRRYDDLSAETLFRRYGSVTDALYDDLVQPMLHVLPMAPGYDVSAAAALSCFHCFALQSRGAFDVRWCKGGISEKIFAPWQAKLEARGNVELRGGARVRTVTEEGQVTEEQEGRQSGRQQQGGRRLAVEVEGTEEPLIADAVVLAVGGTAAARLRDASPALSGLPTTVGFPKIRGITCVAARLYLRPAASRTDGLDGGAHGSTLLPMQAARAMAASPVLVAGPGIGGLPELSETGFCVYDLQRMHDEHAAGDLAVIEVDFYRADVIAELDDEAVASLALRAASAALGIDPGVLNPRMLVDKAVVRARNAVSHFAVGSAALSPPVRLGGGFYAAGDWIDRTGHASWSTEKAVVTGRQAAEAAARDLGLQGVDAAVTPTAEDTVPLQALRRIAGTLRAAVPSSGSDEQLPPPAPWAVLRSLF
jgi:uncharacterized protein with NAD-binding domain and iron-sulfur cluster